MRNTFKIERQISRLFNELDIPIYKIRRENKWALSSIIYLNEATEYVNKKLIMILYNDDLDNYPVILRNVQAGFRETFSVNWDLSNIDDLNFFVKKHLKNLQK